MRVELKERKPTVGRRSGSQQREADGVVAAEAEHAPALIGNRAGRLLDGAVTSLDVHGARRRITGIRDLNGGERRDRLRVVVGPEEQ